MADRRRIALKGNGTVYEREVQARVHLADFLRHEIGVRARGRGGARGHHGRSERRAVTERADGTAA